MRLAALFALLLAFNVASSARAQQREVDLLLVLAIDVSGSVNEARFQLQRQGYAEALADPRVISAIRGGPLGAIAVTVVQWTGPAMQVDVVDWMVVQDAATAQALANRIAAAPRVLFGGGTSISGAIDHGRQLLLGAPFSAPRRVIDVSGDGANNRGEPSWVARDRAVGAAITINGAPILELEPMLDQHYREEVIGGPGAFALPAATYLDFAQVIRQKLILEIAGMPASEVMLAARSPEMREPGIETPGTHEPR